MSVSYRLCQLISSRALHRDAKGHIFYRCGFLSFFRFLFFRRLIFESQVTERSSTKLGHIFIYDCYLKKFGPNSPGHVPPRAVGKNRFGDRLWTLTESISATEHDINNRKETCQSTGTPLHAPKLGELWSRNSWERLASFFPTHLPKFSH